MKLISLILLFVFSLSYMALAQSPGAPSGSPAAVSSPGPVIAAPMPAVPVGFFGFVKANLAAIGLAVYALLDVLVLAIPSLNGYGVVHQIIIIAAKAAGIVPPAS